MADYIMAIDQGTTSTRAVIFDKKGQPQWSFQSDITQHYPEPGWVEHDANEIWIKTLQVIAGALIESGLNPNQIDGIGITNQRETTVVWDKETGQPIYNAIVWQSRQTSPIADKLIEDGHKELFHKKQALSSILTSQQQKLCGYWMKWTVLASVRKMVNYYLEP